MHIHAYALGLRRARPEEERSQYLDGFVGTRGQRGQNFNLDRNRRLRTLNLGFGDLESDPELAHDLMRDFPDLAQELLYEQQQANAPIAMVTTTPTTSTISDGQVLRNEPAPTIHSEPIVASSVLVNPSTPRSSAAFDSPEVTTASTVTPVHATRYAPGVQVIPFAPFGDATVNPRMEAATSVTLTAHDQRVNTRVKKISGHRARVSTCALIDIFLVMLWQFYLPYWGYRLLLLICPVCGYYGSRSLVPRRLVFYMFFSVAMLIMRIVYFTQSLMQPATTFAIVLQGLVLIYAMWVSKEVATLYGYTYAMDRPQALKMLVQINLHSNGHNGFHQSGARIGPELAPRGEVTWSRHTDHHHHNLFDPTADEELGVRQQPSFHNHQSESISLREALSEASHDGAADTSPPPIPMMAHD